MKFFNEYTRAVLSEVAVAINGRPLGFGIETQALEVDIGLNSARGSIRRRVGEAMLCWRVVDADADGGAFLLSGSGSLAIRSFRLFFFSCTGQIAYYS